MMYKSFFFYVKTITCLCYHRFISILCLVPLALPEILNDPQDWSLRFSRSYRPAAWENCYWDRALGSPWVHLLPNSQFPHTRYSLLHFNYQFDLRHYRKKVLKSSRIWLNASPLPRKSVIQESVQNSLPRISFGKPTADKWNCSCPGHLSCLS